MELSHISPGGEILRQESGFLQGKWFVQGSLEYEAGAIHTLLRCSFV
jgi:hypothetical protein